MNMKIYTHDEAALIVEAFENVLEKYGVKLPSPEDDEREEDNEAPLYGSTYGDLLDTVENALLMILGRYEAGAEVIPDVFSSTI